MRRALEKKISSLLKKRQSKEAIYRTLGSDSNREELTHLLNSLPREDRRKKALPLTLLLVVLLAMLTLKQFLFLYLHSHSLVAMLLGAVGPVVHLYVIHTLLRAHRLAYQALPILAVLALFRPENRISPDMYMYICLAVLAGALHLFLFPKGEQMAITTH